VRRIRLTLLTLVCVVPLFALGGHAFSQAGSQAQPAAAPQGARAVYPLWPATPTRRPAPGPDWVKAHYTKREAMIPMRDGVRLFTAIYSPRDTSLKYPILMTRTPYSVRPYGEDQYPGSLGPAPEFAEEGFIFVYQDVRGAFMSEGAYVNMRPVKESYQSAKDIDETTDTYDTVDWLIKNVKNNNGRVGQYGISYPGFYTVATRTAHRLMLLSPYQSTWEWNTWLISPWSRE
jgi:predicted acyl esterase